MTSENKECCPMCGRSINIREIALFGSLVDAIFKVWKYCEEKGEYTFTRKEVKGMFKNENVTARFGDMVLFGGILYHPDKKKGVYGFNIKRAREFFKGELAIPTRALKDPINKVIQITDHRKINEIKGLTSFLNDNLEYVAKYYNQITI